MLHILLTVFELYEATKKRARDWNVFAYIRGESAHKGTFIRGDCSSAEERSIPKSPETDDDLIKKTLFSNIISLLLPSLAFLYRVYLWQRGSKAVQATCSWDKVSTQPTESGQCYNIIGNHFCQYGVSMWEWSLQYSSHRKLQGGLFSCAGCLWGFFFVFLQIFLLHILSQHIQGVTNLLNCASKCEDGKLLRKTKIFFFSSCMRFRLWKQRCKWLL